MRSSLSAIVSKGAVFAKSTALDKGRRRPGSRCLKDGRTCSIDARARGMLVGLQGAQPKIQE
jgi:hypothetical protein